MIDPKRKDLIESFSLFDNEQEPISINEFRVILKRMVDEYVDDLADQNEFARSNHTFKEWAKSFSRFISW